MDLSNYLDAPKLLAKREQFKRIFFYRICGTGMGAAACLLKENGYHVEGADSQFYPPMGDYLKSTGIPCHQLKDFDPLFLKSFDLIVVGNVVPKNSVDAQTIEQSGVPFCSFPAALGAFVLRDVNVIGIAGTHGKTTTTYFATQIFEKLEGNPGYLIGGVMEGRPSAKLGNGRYFFIESDEYDSGYFEKYSKFQSYEIDHLVLTSLEFDHADIFANLEAIKSEFRQLFKKITSGVIFCSDYEATLELKSEFEKERSELYWMQYGTKDHNGPKIMSSNDKETTFVINNKTFKTNVVGFHNILNLSSIILYAIEEGFSDQEIQGAITNLKMVRRRQELRGYYKSIPVIDDFAHHPRAVELTLNALKDKYPGRNIVVIMEPNSATARSNIFQNEFLDSLAVATQVIFAKPVRPTSVGWAQNLDVVSMAKALNQKNISSTVVESLEELRKELDQRLTSDSLLAVLSNGTCLGLWESSFVTELSL